MKTEIEINEWIESYLNGDLSTGETGLFRKRLEEDPSFAREVDMHRQLRAWIEDGTYLNVKNELKDIHIRKTRLSKNFKRITGFGIGCLMIGFVLLLVFRNTRSTKESYTIPAISMTTTDTADTFFSKAGKQSPTSLVKKVIPLEPLNRPVQDDMNRMSGDSIVINNSALEDTQKPLPGTLEEVKLPVGDKTPGPVKQVGIDCRKTKFKVELTVLQSCNNKATGSFTIHRESVSGGKPPYSFSLNTSRFYDTLQFAALFPGNYPVYVKDGNNCIGMAGVAQIGSVDCTYQAVFAPLKGETWTVPVEAGKEGTLQVISKSGTLVYSIKFTNNDIPVWNGETTTGQQLPMGIYQFEITYSNGSRFMGNVTIVR